MVQEEEAVAIVPRVTVQQVVLEAIESGLLLRGNQIMLHRQVSVYNPRILLTRVVGTPAEPDTIQRPRRIWAQHSYS